MKYIENEKYFHIQRIFNGETVQLWSTGETYEIGNDTNRFFGFYNKYDRTHNPHSIQSVKEILGHQIKLTRELLFEEVRREFFEELPSRYKCLWVVKKEESLVYWQNELSGSGKILTLELTGKIHESSQGFLKSTTQSLNTIRENAIKYWEGSPGENENETEILFEGFAKVIEEREF